MNRVEAEALRKWVEDKLSPVCQALTEALIAAPCDSLFREIRAHRDALERIAIRESGKTWDELKRGRL